DPYSITVSAIATAAGATPGKYQAVAVFDSSGNALLNSSLSMPGTGANWNKFTSGLPVTLSPGWHSWCWAFEATASAWTVLSTFSNVLNPGTTGAKIHNYTCSVAPTGSGSSFSIPTNGNCAASG